MERARDLSKRPRKPIKPAVKLDETAMQLAAQAINPQPLIPCSFARFETVYKRNDAAKRHFSAPDTRIKLDKHYPTFQAHRTASSRSKLKQWSW